MSTNDKLADALRLIGRMRDALDTSISLRADGGNSAISGEATAFLAAHAASLAAPPAQGERVIDAVRDVMHEVFKYADIAAPLRGPPMTQDESLPVRKAAAAQDKIIRDMLYALAAPQPAPAPVQVDAVPRCPKCGYTYEDCLIHWDHRLCGEPDPSAAAQPPAPGEAELPALPARFMEFLPAVIAKEMRDYARTAIAALAQRRVDLEQFRGAVSLLHLTCRRRLRDVRKGVFPAHYLPIFEQDLAQASALLDLIDSQQESRK